jgi:hypothetical protein
MDSSAEMVDCQNLASGSQVDIETTTRRYRVECLGGNRIRISGHPEYCPGPTPAWLEGSIAPDGSIEPGLIGLGRRMVFLVGEFRPITTSKVIRVNVDHAAALNLSYAPSVC